MNNIAEHFAGNYLPFYERYIPNLKRAGKEHQGCCPFHADKTPSLSVNNETGLFYCHGCEAKGDAISFYAKLHNLDARRDFQKILEGICQDFGIDNGTSDKKKIVATYDYQDIAGNLLYQTVRFEPKDFRQRRPDGNGGWHWNLQGVETLLYNLPSVTAAQEVLIPEGEKDVETARKMGFTATCNPLGAGKWRDTYSDFLKEKDVVIIADNDDPGIKHADAVAQSLQGKAKSIKIIQFEEMPKGADLTDFANQYQDPTEAAERLAMMIDGTPESNYKADEPRIYTIADAVMESADFLRLEIPPRRSYLHPIIQEKYIGLFSGPKGIGKTWLGLSAADAITRCQNLGPWEIREPATCLYLDGEMAEIDVQNNLRLLNPSTVRVKPLYVYSDCYANSLGISRAYLLSEKWQKETKDLLIHLGVKVFFIDNIASLAPGIDENDKKFWDPVNQWVISLRFNGISTYLFHHTNKEGEQRGTSAREDNIDISVLLKHPKDYSQEDGADFVVSFTKSRLPFADLKYIQAVRFTLRTDERGQTNWLYQNEKARTKEEILRLLSEKYSQKDVAAMLGVSAAFVCNVKAGKK